MLDNIKNIYTASQEYNPLILDKFNRFRAYMSSNSTLNPELSKFLQKEGFQPAYKENKKFAVCISHDVDFIYENKNSVQYLKSSFKSLKQKKFKQGYYNLISTVKSVPNPNWTIDFF